MTEADTCRTYVLPRLYAAGWTDDHIAEQRMIAPGRIVPIGHGHTRKESLRPDYILYLKKHYPIAVVEAKAEYKHPGDGIAAGDGLRRRRSGSAVCLFQQRPGHRRARLHHRQGNALARISRRPMSSGRACAANGIWPTNRDAADALTAYFEEIGGKVAALLSGDRHQPRG